MKKEKFKIKAKEDFGTWLRKGEIIEVTETWALFSLDRDYAKLLKGEARKLKGVTLLKKYGLPPYKSVYTRKQMMEILLKFNDMKKNTIEDAN